MVWLYRTNSLSCYQLNKSYYQYYLYEKKDISILLRSPKKHKLYINRYDLILIVSTNIYISYHVNNYKVNIFIIQCSQLKKYNCFIHNY